MNNELSLLVNRLEEPLLFDNDVIPWSSPIPAFGNISVAKVATLGLNPSNREFVDLNGNELDGSRRRFHTLKSLGLNDWSEANEQHLGKIKELCDRYFDNNPYDGWFKKLDFLISGTSTSYYFPSGEACHLDLIPYATSSKWTDLTSIQKSTLLDFSADILGLLLQNSAIELVVLNGQTVVDNFIKITNIQFQKEYMEEWSLPRKKQSVPGYSYYGVIRSIAEIDFDRDILILGYNHNIQSSFGVTTEVQLKIRNWISLKSKELFNETSR